jgi:flagellar biosynthesis protein FliR
MLIVMVLGLGFLPHAARISLSVALSVLLVDQPITYTYATMLRCVGFSVVVGLSLKILFGMLQWQADIIVHSTGLKSLGEHSTLLENVYVYTLMLGLCSIGIDLLYIKVLVGLMYNSCVSISAPLGVFALVVQNVWQMCLPVVAVGLAVQLIIALFNRLVPQVPVFFVGQPLAVLVGLYCLAQIFESHPRLICDFALSL